MVNLDNTLDRWILSFTQSLVLFVEQEMAGEFPLPFICNHRRKYCYILFVRDFEWKRWGTYTVVDKLLSFARCAWWQLKRDSPNVPPWKQGADSTIAEQYKVETLLMVAIFFLKHWTFADFFKLRCMLIDSNWKIKRPLPKKTVVLQSINCSWIGWTQSIAKQPLNRSPGLLFLFNALASLLSLVCFFLVSFSIFLSISSLHCCSSSGEVHRLSDKCICKDEQKATEGKKKEPFH